MKFVNTNFKGIITDLFKKAFKFPTKDGEEIITSIIAGKVEIQIRNRKNFDNIIMSIGYVDKNRNEAKSMKTMIIDDKVINNKSKFNDNMPKMMDTIKLIIVNLFDKFSSEFSMVDNVYVSSTDLFNVSSRDEIESYDDNRYDARYMNHRAVFNRNTKEKDVDDISDIFDILCEFVDDDYQDIIEIDIKVPTAYCEADFTLVSEKTMMNYKDVLSIELINNNINGLSTIPIRFYDECSSTDISDFTSDLIELFKNISDSKPSIKLKYFTHEGNDEEE